MTKLCRHVAARFAIVAIAASILTLAVFWYFPPADEIEVRLADRIRIAFTEPAPVQDNRISLVVIDEATMATLPYRSPVDRELLAQIVELLHAAGAKAIGIDVLLDQPTEPEKDSRLVAAIAAFGGPVVVAWADARAGMTDAQSAWLTQFLEASGATAGFANLQEDRDGVVRRHFSALSDTTVEGFTAVLAGYASPRDGASSWRIDWHPPQASGAPVFQKTPAHVLPLMQANPQILETWYRDRIVLIGADLPQQDRHLTPLSLGLGGGPTAGVEIHAHLLAQLLDRTVIPEMSPAAASGYVLLMALIAAFLTALPAPIVLRVLFLGALVLGHAVVLSIVFGEFDILLPILAPVVAIVLSAGGAMGVDAVIARHDRRYIKEAFSHYLAPELVNELLLDPEKLKLGGERRFMSFLFTDIAGFTGMSERLEPEVLAKLLNDYLDGVSAIVIRNRGVIDKYIGDAVVALFGVPNEDPAHAAHALNCAAEIDAFAEKFRERHVDVILGITRIGVHSGEAVVGNFGGAAHFDYTAIGDAMNTAARLEGANKAFGTRVCFSGASYDAAAAHLSQTLPVQTVGDVVLKGKVEPITVLALSSDHNPARLEAYAKAYASLSTAGIDSKEAFAALGDDPLAVLHFDRLAQGETGTVFELTEK